MLDRKKKESIIKKFKTHEKDTGSPEVQIAILSEEIRELTDHLKKHKHDFSSRRGLLRKISLRRKLLRYLKKENEKRYEELTKKLKIKKIEELEEPSLNDEDAAPLIKEVEENTEEIIETEKE